MYTLYSQQPSQALRWLADTPTEERARALARLQSKFLPEPVVIVRRFEDNATGVIATFRNGEAQPMLPDQPLAQPAAGLSGQAPENGGVSLS